MFVEQGIKGVVNTDRKVEKWRWSLRHGNPALIAGRAAFLGLIRINFLGFAKIMSRRLFEVDQAFTDTQKVGEKWWDNQKKWRIAWHNLGGNWDKLTAAINKGKGRKAIGFNVAPKKLKEKLKQQGVGGLNFNGIGAVDPATLTAAAGIIAALMPLLLTLLSNLKKDVPTEDIEYVYDDEGGDDGDDDDGGFKLDLKTAGFGLLGVGVLAMLFAGDKFKKKK